MIRRLFSFRFRNLVLLFGLLSQKVRESRLGRATDALTRKVPILRHAIFQNFIVGCLIIVGLATMKDTQWLQEIEDSGVDRVVRVLSNTEQATNKTSPFVLVDLDNRTYLDWGEPQVMPQDHLASLIRSVVKAGALVTVVDLDIRMEQPEKSAELLALFDELNRNPEILGDRHLVLVKTFKVDGGKQLPYKHLRASFLDKAVAQNPNIHWVSSMFTVDQDHIVRRWRLWERGCTQQGTPTILPSVQLFSAMAASDQKAGVSRMYEALKGITPPSCKAWAEKTSATASRATLNIGGHEVPLRTGRNGQRIIYGVPWDLEAGEKRPRIELSGQGKAASTVPVIRRIPARLIAANPNAKLDMKDRIAFVGSSHSESADIHETPIGYMPGVLILANAINSILTFGALAEPSLLVIVVVQLTLVLAFSFIIHHISSTAGVLLCSFIVILSSLPVGIVALNEGVWVDFTLPLIAVQMYDIYLEIRPPRPSDTSQAEPNA